MTTTAKTGLDSLSSAIEALLVARNPRGMQKVRAALTPGYLLRAATLLHQAGPRVLICTGFPRQINRRSLGETPVADFAIKPLSKEELAIMVRNLLDSASGSSRGME